MRSTIQKRILVLLMILSTSSMPCLGLACLSGAEQEAIRNAWTGTATGMVATGLTNTAAAFQTGNALIDAVIAGGAGWAIGLAQQTADGWIAQHIDRHVPDDPFP